MRINKFILSFKVRASLSELLNKLAQREDLNVVSVDDCEKVLDAFLFII